MKAVISAQRMLIAELLKTNRSEKMIEYWINEVRERSIILENALQKERAKEEEKLSEIFGHEFIKNLQTAEICREILGELIINRVNELLK